MVDDYNTAYDEMYDIGATNAGVLALVNSVFLRDGLTNLANKQLPYLVWQYDRNDGALWEMTDVNANWWIYIAPSERPRALYAIAHALDVAYEDWKAVSGGDLSLGKPGAPFIDKALNGLQGMRIPVTWRTLG